MLLPRSGLAAGREDGMALDPKAQAALALHRFGLGPRAGSIASIASDPRGALLAELDRPGAGRINNPELLTSGAAARTAFAYQQAQRAARQAERAAQQANAPSGAGSAEMKDQSATPPAPAARPSPGPGVPQQIYLPKPRRGSMPRSAPRAGLSRGSSGS